MIIKLQKFVLASLLVVIIPACSSIGISNPFGSDSNERSQYPKDATEYMCDSNKRFHVRMLNNGSDAWLIYPDHEVNLPQSSDDNRRYASGVIALVINGDATTLNDGEKIAYLNCKPQLKK
jgi:membrane-bound inhibitor of C-type lysozyme